MASLEDLKAAVGGALEGRGTLESVRARLRAEVFHAIQGQEAPVPKPAPDTRLLNELIREYLQYNGYAHTASVFAAENGQTQGHGVGMDVVHRDLGTLELQDGSGMPTLYHLVSHMRARRRQAEVAGVAVPPPAAEPPHRVDILSSGRLSTSGRLSGSRLSTSGRLSASLRSSAPPTPTPPPVDVSLWDDVSGAGGGTTAWRTSPRSLAEKFSRPRGAPRDLEDSTLSFMSGGGDSVPSQPQGIEFRR